MSKLPVFPDVSFESEPIGLADAFAALSEPATIVLETEAATPDGSVIFFGLSTPSGEIMEAKGRVRSSAPRAGGFALTVEVLEVDSAYEKAAPACLRAGDRPTDGQEPLWGIAVKQTNNSYAVLINSPAGVISAAQLARIAEIAAQGAGCVKLTHAQRAILFTSLDKMDEVKARLAEVGLQIGVLHRGVRNIRACCGSLCRFAQNVDAVSTALSVDKALYGHGTKFDVKVAISDCQRNCSESYCADIGLIGGKGSYRLVIGGRGSQVPFRAVQIADDIKPADVPATIKKVVDWYESHAAEGERLWKLMVRLGEAEARNHDVSALETVMKQIGDGVNEVDRMRDLVARLVTARRIRQELMPIATS